MSSGAEISADWSVQAREEADFLFEQVSSDACQSHSQGLYIQLCICKYVSVLMVSHADDFMLILRYWGIFPDVINIHFFLLKVCLSFCD